MQIMREREVTPEYEGSKRPETKRGEQPERTG